LKKFLASIRQGTTLDEARENLTEALAMILEANRELEGFQFTQPAFRDDHFILHVRSQIDACFAPSGHTAAHAWTRLNSFGGSGDHGRAKPEGPSR